MSTDKHLTTVGILLALVSLAFIPVAAQTYTATDLGTLGGTFSNAFAVGESGAVVGWADPVQGGMHAFLWMKATGMIDLCLLNSGDYFSAAYGLNRAGQVVGQSGSSAFIWTKGTMQDIGSLGRGAAAFGINNAGQVVGLSITNTSQIHAFLWTNIGGMQDLGTLGGQTSIARAINDSAQVVGSSTLSDNVTTHAFLWTATGGMQDLGTLGGTDSDAYAINASGEVVGSSSDAHNNQVAFLWDSVRGMQALGGGDDPGANVAFGINQSRQVVGVFAGVRGFLWTRNDGIKNLNALIFPKNLLVSSANAANTASQIVGTDNKNHAVLVTPTK